MAKYYDISEWNKLLHLQTRGTRSKVVVSHPISGELYYFKSSHKKEKIDYKYEFWSEIIASEVGKTLGFDMLEYNIAYNEGEIGCISKSMVTEGKNNLTEGISYLTGYDNTYNPQDKQSYNAYTFQFIRKALGLFRLGDAIPELIKVIILDSLLGNSDRHQENWGFITEYNDIIEEIKKSGIEVEKNIVGKFFIKFMSAISKENSDDFKKVVKNIDLIMPSTFAPIYDSGSCLGREKTDSSVTKMLTDKNMLEAYINRGKAEIRWENEQLSHFGLIEKVKTEYPSIVNAIIDDVVNRFNEQRIREIVSNIDRTLPENLNIHKLPDERKELISKMITLRLNKLKGLRS